MLSKSTVLVVDDEPVILKLMTQLLKNDYQVKLLNTGLQVVEVCKSDVLPDLILLDISMPGKDGYAVLRDLKADKATRNIPVIFVTARIEESDEQAGFDLGAVDYIPKPIRPAIVKARVRAQLELKMVRDHLEEMVALRTAELNQANIELKNNFLETVKSFAYLIEQRDASLGAHSRRVADRSRKLAVEMSLPQKQIDDVFLAGLLSRIGSLTLSDKMLARPMHRMLKEEREEFIDHLIQAKILFLRISSLHDMANLIENQYEHFGGTGAPAGKIAEQIPLGSRIIAVVRDYDLLVEGKMTDKLYSASEATDYLRRYSGSYYDPQVVETFTKVFGRVKDKENEQFLAIGLDALVEDMDIVEVKMGKRVYVRNLQATREIIDDLALIQRDTGRKFEIVVRVRH